MFRNPHQLLVYLVALEDSEDDHDRDFLRSGQALSERLVTDGHFDQSFAGRDFAELGRLLWRLKQDGSITFIDTHGPSRVGGRLDPQLSSLTRDDVSNFASLKVSYAQDERQRWPTRLHRRTPSQSVPPSALPSNKAPSGQRRSSRRSRSSTYKPLSASSGRTPRRPVDDRRRGARARSRPRHDRRAARLPKREDRDTAREHRQRSSDCGGDRRRRRGPRTHPLRRAALAPLASRKSDQPAYESAGPGNHCPCMRRAKCRFRSTLVNRHAADADRECLHPHQYTPLVIKGSAVRIRASASSIEANRL